MSVLSIKGHRDVNQLTLPSCTSLTTHYCCSGVSVHMDDVVLNTIGRKILHKLNMIDQKTIRFFFMCEGEPLQHWTAPMLPELITTKYIQNSAIKCTFVSYA